MRRVKIDKSTSDGLRAVTACCVIMVLAIHSYWPLSPSWTDEYTTADKCVDTIQYVVSQAASRCAVPTLFLISGFLFALNFRRSMDWVLGKWRRRVWTLLLPLCLWTVAGYVATIVAAYGVAIVGCNLLGWTGVEIEKMGVLGHLRLLLDNRVVYHLWFVRHLIVLVLLCPAVLFIPRLARLGVVASLGVCWCCGAGPWYIGTDGPAMYLIGCVLAVEGVNLAGLYRYRVTITVAWFVACVVQTLQCYVVGAEVLWLRQAAIICGICWLLSNSRWLADVLKRRKLWSIVKYAFFVYLAHEPVLTIVKKSVFSELHHVWYWRMIGYLVCPLLAGLSIMACGSLMRRTIPRGYSVLTGGR